MPGQNLPGDAGTTQHNNFVTSIKLIASITIMTDQSSQCAHPHTFDDQLISLHTTLVVSLRLLSQDENYALISS